MSGTHLTLKNLYAFIQARTGSTRLPWKVLRELPNSSGITLLDHIHSRVSRVIPSSRIVYLIPDGDSELQDFLLKKKRNVYQGPLEDVRLRYIRAAERFGADAILRLTGDNPFYDVPHLELLVQSFALGTSDLSYFQGLPLGTGGEIFRTSALVWEPKTGLEERHQEHVSLHIKESPDQFKILSLPNLIPQQYNSKSISELRLTIDTEQDFDTISKILTGPAVRAPRDKNGIPLFDINDLLNWLQSSPRVFEGNREIEQIRFKWNPTKIRPKGTAGILAAPAKDFGSGHESRMKLLYSLLPDRNWKPIWLESFPEDGEVDLLIVDYRDISIKNQYLETKVLVLDHFGSERNLYQYHDLLPHPKNEANFDWDNVLLPPIVTSKALQALEETPENYSIFCYAGNIEQKMCRELDQALLSTSPTGKILRIGGADPIPETVGTIVHYKRISNLEFYESLKHSNHFFGYFGQSLLEAMYLKKSVATFSISSAHHVLSDWMQKTVGVPYFTHQGKIQFSTGTKKPGPEGYRILLERIDRFSSL
ncbi:spore coat biosynthesis protein F [Leptospira perolatii]|uniref:Spore coat biosynthesis protein F n=1 Tax=Leptospira perolatii TaxID=2023191 RepID=A0A2M9ZM65_9LEPT|nr:spore coat biosynthesis protein F [Leptospira perolatii]PJZ69172.1 spore coat biosynthesis protein F [Leptospira perolatii]PJZ73084.1 spore coat biosynthesis protein F [Leptospira perolatii]